MRRRWRNHTGNEGIDPLQILEPTTLEAIVEIVRHAERVGCTVRAVGSGHSWSDVALTPGFLIRPTGLARPLELERDLLRPGIAGTSLVRMQSGIRIRELNAYLDSLGLALPNMGGYDGQTIAGVISTSTHGSGLRFGPLPDIVRSMDIVASGGQVYRLERADGPTDPESYARAFPDRSLFQDDSTFRAAVVGMGCMGVIYSLVLEVQPKFYLREVRTTSNWTSVREQLRSGTVLRENRHYEVLFNPYEYEGDHGCLITTRNEISAEQYDRDPHRDRHFLVEFFSSLPVTPVVINLASGIRPQLSPFLINQAMKGLDDADYANVSYRVLNIGAANRLPAYSCEIGIPIDQRELHIAAVERIFEVAARHRDEGKVYQSSPISLRFVRESDAYMSMMNGSDTMMIELIMLTHTEGGFELLADYENELYAYGGRPHWGQVNTLTGSDGLVASMYPHMDRWLEVHEMLNASGVFDSPFSKRVGITRARFVP
jgi:hypothetical protein